MAIINGSSRRDYLKGGNGSDDITGFKGGDWLKGKDGDDNFIYTSIDDSPASWGIGTFPFIGFLPFAGYFSFAGVYSFPLAGRFPFYGPEQDVILDFTQGEDKIDLAAILGNQNLNWGNTTPTAQGVWYSKIGFDTHIFVDTEGSKFNPEMHIVLKGRFKLTENDFILIPPNLPPVVVDDEIYVTDATSVIIPWDWLLENDSDPNFDPLEITAVSITGSDEFSVDPVVDSINKTITFTTDPNIIADADTTLSYTVSDGLHAVDGTVTVHVLNRLALLNDDIAINDADYQGSYLDAGGGVLDILTGGNTHDVLIGGPGFDRLTGNGGDDILTGGPGPLDGADQFRFNSADDGTDTITDFTLARGLGSALVSDKIGINQSFVNFANTGTSSSGTSLNSSDYYIASSISNIGAGDNGVVEISTAQTTAQITGDTGGSGQNIFALLFNSDTGKGELWFDTDWSDISNRVQLVTFDNITTLTGVTDFINTDFVQFS